MGPKQLRHYSSANNVSWEECRLGDNVVEKINLQNAASLEEADKREEMTAE